MNITSSKQWLIPTSAVKAGASAVLGNEPMFYAVHLSACINGVASLLGCIAVLLHVAAVPVPRVVSVWTRGLFHPWGTDRTAAKRVDFSARFSRYLAVADLIWHTSHLTDHALLLAHKEYPEDSLATGLALNLFVWFGWCQMLHCALSAYSYLKICRNVHLKFGRHDWRLHVVTFGSVVVLAIIFYVVNGFGSSAYWCLGNNQTFGGSMVSFMSSMVATTNAMATTIGNREIQKKVSQVSLSTKSTASRPTTYKAGTSSRASAQQPPASPDGSVASSKRGMLAPGGGGGATSSTGGGTSSTGGTSSAHGDPSSDQRSYVAAQCLRTLVRTARLVYIPLAIGSLTGSLLIFIGIVEPITCFITATAANCSGWVNAYAYFHNELLKASLRAGTLSAAPSQAGTIQSGVGARTATVDRSSEKRPSILASALAASLLRGGSAPPSQAQPSQPRNNGKGMSGAADEAKVDAAT
ncbi:hypothetical protein H9P43_002893 [Blastocladiella emersonii ATCC 22665]|nr:hypothetical protein H9P43_002893 [Blastocladiella emersonii ATCC 22665]